MKQADRIREYVFLTHIQPARGEGQGEVTIRAGDIHRDMQLRNAMPAVCAAIDSRKFHKLADVALLRREGPARGANVYFTFRLDAPTGTLEAHRTSAPPPTPLSLDTPEPLNLDDALVLVSCVKTKLDHPAPAKDLYCSAWFGKVRALIEESSADWLVLSALHGLVGPDEIIEPYEVTLNQMRVRARRDWANQVLADLLPKASAYPAVVFFAGQRYREFLEEPLKAAGARVSVPMKGLQLGHQLSWLDAHL